MEPGFKKLDSLILDGPGTFNDETAKTESGQDLLSIKEVAEKYGLSEEWLQKEVERVQMEPDEEEYLEKEYSEVTL